MKKKSKSSKQITWSIAHDDALFSAHRWLKEREIVLEHDGHPNASAIILHALRQLVKRK